eukprot:IDg5149t1
MGMRVHRSQFCTSILVDFCCAWARAREQAWTQSYSNTEHFEERARPHRLPPACARRETSAEGGEVSASVCHYATARAAAVALPTLHRVGFTPPCDPKSDMAR